MNSDEVALLWKQLETLHETVSGMIELQRAALNAPPSQPPAAADALLARLDALQDRLRPLQREAAERAARSQSLEEHRFEELSVERLNVIAKDGTLRLCLTNPERAPHPMLDGKPTGERTGGNLAGLYFYNDEGDECGGLIYGGRREDGSVTADAGLLFDQFKQDQTVGVYYADENGERTAGLKVWDRPEVPLNELLERMREFQQMPEGPEKAAAAKNWWPPEAWGGRWERTRVFVGKNPEKEAVVELHDTQGKLRLRLRVDTMGKPGLEFLDEEGRVTYSLTDKGNEPAPGG